MLIKFTLIKCAPGRSGEVAEKIVQLAEATEIYTVLGQYDLLVKFRMTESSSNSINIEQLIDEKIHPIDGIAETNTIDTKLWFG